ncbi:MAG: malectin domain-containing carbohydrate-binding protein [Luminiphilus sp.]|nr:malectin domain-containing carbohydrate-binding protein [Luminiphilus sp.]
MRASVLVLLSLITPHPACFGETNHALNFGSTQGVWWQQQYFEGTRCRDGLTCNRINSVSGTDEPALFESHIEGPFDLERVVPNSTYDVTLFLAEPGDAAQNARTFDVMIQNEPVIKALDVMRYRDGQAKSALTVTLLGIRVTEQRFLLELRAGSGNPLLSGLYLASKKTQYETCDKVGTGLAGAV